MQAESTISEFIRTFIEMAKDPGVGLPESELELLQKVLEVAKTVHVAQLSIKKLVGEIDGEN